MAGANAERTQERTAIAPVNRTRRAADKRGLPMPGTLGDAMTTPDKSWEASREEESFPPSSTVSFLHAVGQSTLRQGLAVPLIAQISWLKDIEKGQCVPV